MVLPKRRPEVELCRAGAVGDVVDVANIAVDDHRRVGRAPDTAGQTRPAARGARVLKERRRNAGNDRLGVGAEDCAVAVHQRFPFLRFGVNVNRLIAADDDCLEVLLAENAAHAAGAVALVEHHV